MIEVSDLSKRYGTFTAVNHLSFTVRPGEVLGLAASELTSTIFSSRVETIRGFVL